MDLEDKFNAKASGVQSLSSSVHSTPGKIAHSGDALRNPELLQEIVKSGIKKELQSCFEKEKRNQPSSKRKMTELKTSNKTLKIQEQRQASSNINSHFSKKQHRKGGIPIRLAPATEQSSDVECNGSWVCKNSACRAIISTDYTFCKRCSCCICHLFDDNKDPSLWLVCNSDSEHGESCELSCHIECALQRDKVGVVNLGQLMQLDGSYCCASCGKVSGILGCWKKQLIIAKEARRVDVLCYRIFLSYRLLVGTCRFKDFHAIVCEAKSKLETEVGPITGVSAKMARGIVSRLPIAGDVQQLCSLAIDKADQWMSFISSETADCREDSLPAACKFLFEEVTPSSITIVLIEPPQNASIERIKGYKLWYCKATKGHTKEPICVFPRAQRRVLITNLQPCTEYTFRIISYTETGDLGHSEAKCFTRSVEIIHKTSTSKTSVEASSSSPQTESIMPKSNEAFHGFKVRDLGKVLHLACAHEKSYLDGIGKCIKIEAIEEDRVPHVSRGLDLNVSVPDLNEDVAPLLESSRDEANINGFVLENAVEEKQHANEETHECDSTLINGSPFRMPNCSGCLDENFEYCVKIIRWLECEGHIKHEFRLKLLTWFSLRSTEQERRVVNTFIQTLIDDPGCLAGQLVDSFSDIVSSRKLQNGFCGKLWH